MPSSEETRAVLAFAVCWGGAAASVALEVPALAAAFMVGGLVAWGVGMRASIRDGRRRLDADPEVGARWPRQRVARALVLSWMLPGLGELFLGLPRRRALLTMR